jgi:hypothetical protein
MLPAEHTATYDAVASSVADPLALLAQLDASDESLHDLAERVALRASLLIGDVMAMFRACMDDETHGDGFDQHDADEWAEWE